MTILSELFLLVLMKKHTHVIVRICDIKELG